MYHRACIEPPPTPDFSCNNVTGVWTIQSLTVYFGQEVIVSTPSIVLGNLDVQTGAVVTFTNANLLFVLGCTTIAGQINLDFGSSSDDVLFTELITNKPSQMTLISGSQCFQVTSVIFRVYYTGGCTTISGSLNLLETTSADFPYILAVNHIKSTGTGNCHWLWTTLSMVGALVTLIAVPLIEKYVWKLYD